MKALKYKNRWMNRHNAGFAHLHMPHIHGAWLEKTEHMFKSGTFWALVIFGAFIVLLFVLAILLPPQQGQNIPRFNYLPYLP